MKATLDIIRRLRDTTGLKVNRSFGGFFADRLVQAMSRATLLDAVEHLAQSLDAQIEYIGGAKIAPFVTEASGPQAPAILHWMREHPSIVAMIASLRDEGDYADAIASIPLQHVETDDSVVTAHPSYDIPLHLDVLTGLAHGADRKAGNATLFRRRSVITATGKHLALPIYAGNAVRGQMRDLLTDHFLTSLGLSTDRSKPVLALWAFHAFYAGGVLEGNSKLDKELGNAGAVKADAIRDLRNSIPMLSLLGSAMGNRIISGRVQVGDFRPRCREWGTGDVRADELIEWVFLTRRDDYEGRQEGDDHAGMIATSEVLKAGTVMDGGIDVGGHATSLERACLGRGLHLLADRGLLGADNRRGIGKVRLVSDAIPDPTEYDTYLAANKADILAYLHRLGALCEQPSLFG
ncbi:MAG: hypothetical protein ABS84_04295 [Rubrivivax sp. SCN 71-131]|nr:MAG: hypothetical protein ABS84_04295 [Rubrivivax sp. SCN 71-131]